jgi:hypothetical protein
MPNRSQEENDAIMLNALRTAGEKGLVLDEIRVALFGAREASNSLTKKMLERLKSKGHICIKMSKSGPYYMILPGH